MSLSLFIPVLFSAMSILAAAEIPVVRGRVHATDHDALQGLNVSIDEASSHAGIAQMDVRLDGSFEFRDIPSGEYVLHITDGRGTTILQEFVSIREQMPELDVRLPNRESNRDATESATVSLRELLHPPDRKAVRAFQSALRLADAGKFDDAAAELEKSIRISPDFAAAHANLAVQYFRLRRYEDSAAESARAIEIGGPRALSLCNLATAQAHLQRWEEAEKSARAALRLDSSYVQANLILGFILVDDPGTRSEGIKNLEKAAPRFGSAQLFLERLRDSH